jgi:hypothetical protein
MNCQLFEIDGTPISACSVRVTGTAASTNIVAWGFPQPGLIVDRLLLGQVREVWVQMGSGEPERASVKRVYFSARLGRTCLLQLQTPLGAAATGGRRPANLSLRRASARRGLPASNQRKSPPPVLTEPTGFEG